VRTPDNLKGIGLTFLAMAMLPYLDVCAKFLGQQQIPVIEIAWARVFFGALMILPFAVKVDRAKALIPRPLGLQLLRCLAHISATFAFFTALKFMPIADTMAVWYIEPILLLLLSVWLLKEKLDLYRVVAVIAGFCGTLIVIRPGLVATNPGVPFALFSGLAFAFYLLITRLLAGKARAVTTTFQTNALGAVICSALLPWVWVWPTSEQWLLMLAMAAFGTLGHYLAARAYDYAEASLLATLAYSEIAMSIFAGWLFFSDLPDRWTLLGITVLIACAAAISWRERSIAIAQPPSP
jgi:drug/metabolite transporter (DMT)-like permease